MDDTVNPAPDDETTEPTDLVVEDLIEEVSIDGMCGVY
jgi:mycofactocin precursor